jgi:hypothetical protein
MQDRYAGDIGDYFKYGLLRRLSQGRSLGILWYLFPDEDHNADGGYVDYLDDPETWEDHDPDVFNALKWMVFQNHRNVATVAQSGILGNATFAYERLDPVGISSNKNSEWRKTWFNSAFKHLKNCNLIFADPDNGLCLDEAFKPGQKKHWKRIPLNEVKKLSQGRTAIIYHHNTRYKGGNEEEISYWLEHLGAGAVALRWRASSNRTFFIINPTKTIRKEAEHFASDWGEKAEFYTR